MSSGRSIGVERFVASVRRWNREGKVSSRAELQEIDAEDIGSRSTTLQVL